ncbi:NifB/NifX family molybdenum-iron cluster-binding protein [Blastopirellula sediminis]|nr:NifB/NifX family molybdenum-iron cluster-binding protein [Blastopirellula sediminis]
MGPLLSRELAHRVAMAAHVLGIEPRAMLLTLFDAVGLPFSKARFTMLTVSDLREGLEKQHVAIPTSSETPEKEQLLKLKHAVRCIWGYKDDDRQRLPEPTGRLDSPLPGSIRVAVATSTGKQVDERFGGALRFFVYQVSKEETQLVDVRSAAEAVDSEDAIDFRAQLIPDCQVLYTQAIGGHVAAKVIQRGVYPLTVDSRPKVDEVLDRLQQKMQDNPPPWLAKAMDIPLDDRIRFQDQGVLEPL